MGFPKHIYRKANAILSERRQTAQRNAELTKQDLYHAIPQLLDIEKQLSDCGRGLIAAVAAGKSSRDMVEQLKNRSLSLQEQRKELLKQYDIPEGFLDVPYHCPLCQDQGYVGTRRCQCMEKLLRELASKELGGEKLERYSFQNFRLDYYGDQPDPHYGTLRNYMSRLKDFCEGYAASFSPEHSPSLLFVGGTGLGKTHLSFAIAREVIDRGYGVIYASAQNLLSRLEEERFNRGYGDEEEQRYLSMVMDTDLLILDDLGTEFLNQYVTASLYNLIDSRLDRHKATIISTNLLSSEMSKRYSDRLTSRLFGEYTRLEFKGKDIRIQKNLL